MIVADLGIPATIFGIVALALIFLTPAGGSWSDVFGNGEQESDNAYSVREENGLFSVYRNGEPSTTVFSGTFDQCRDWIAEHK